MAEDFKSLVVSLPAALHQQVKIQSALAGIPMTRATRTLLKAWVDGAIVIEAEIVPIEDVLTMVLEATPSEPIT